MNDILFGELNRRMDALNDQGDEGAERSDVVAFEAQLARNRFGNPILRRQVGAWRKKLTESINAYDQVRADVTSCLREGEFVEAAQRLSSAERASTGPEAELLQSLHGCIQHSFWKHVNDRVRAPTEARRWPEELCALSESSELAAALEAEGCATEGAAVLESLELQVLEAQGRSGRALMMRSLGHRLARAQPRRRFCKEDLAGLAMNTAPETLRVGTETQLLAVDGEGPVKIEPPAGLEVRSFQQPHPTAPKSSLVSFVVIPSLRDPFDTELYGARTVVISVGGKPLLGSPFTVEVRIQEPRTTPVPCSSSPGSMHPFLGRMLLTAHRVPMSLAHL